MKNFFTINCILIFFVVLTTSSKGQGIWTKDPANPVLTGVLLNENTCMPTVLYNPHNHPAVKFEKIFLNRHRKVLAHCLKSI